MRNQSGSKRSGSNSRKTNIGHSGSKTSRASRLAGVKRI